MNLQLGKVYTFNTTAPSLLGVTIRNAKLISTMGYSEAIGLENIDLKYRSIYPLLAEGTPDTPEACIYYRFASESGEKIILADQWIQESSIEVIEHIQFRVTFSDASLIDMTRVRDALNALGYKKYKIEQI